MKVFSFGCRPYDEVELFERFSREMGINLGCTKQSLREDSLHLAMGADYVSVLTEGVDAQMLSGLKEMGVKMLGTRTVGYDHIDCAHAKKIGLKVSNSAYSPDAVAEYTIMLMLMALRNAKRIIQRAAINDFTLKGLSGNNLSDRTVGIVGLGSIGLRVAELLKGFGCEVYGCDSKGRSFDGITVLPINELFEKCDVISLHAPSRESTRHMINKDTLALMPKGTVIVNTARGELIDTAALVDALADGHIAACGLDVVEGERELYYYNKKSAVLNEPYMALLRDMPNAILTPHMAFYTHKSVEDMVRNCLKAFVLEEKGESNPFRIV